MRCARCGLLFVLLLLALPVEADEPAWPVGTLFLSFSPEFGDCSGLEGTDFDFYLVAILDYEVIGQPELNRSNSILGWQASLRPDQGITITDAELFPDTAINEATGELNYIVDLGQAIPVSNSPIVLARFHAVTDGHPGWIALGAASPSGFPQYPEGRPGWVDVGGSVDCPSPCLRPFQRTYEGGYLDSSLGTAMTCAPDACWSFIERPLPGATLEGRAAETVLVSTTVPDMQGLHVEYTLDGKTWEWLRSIGYLSPSHGSWSVPNVQTEIAQFRICDDCCWSGPWWRYSGLFSIEKKTAVEASSWGAMKSRFKQ